MAASSAAWGWLIIRKSKKEKLYFIETKKNRKNSETEGKSVDAMQAARDYGIDVAMLIDNLKRTPAERIRRHQIALETAEKLRKARQP